MKIIVKNNREKFKGRNNEGVIEEIKIDKKKEEDKLLRKNGRR